MKARICALPILALCISTLDVQFCAAAPSWLQMVRFKQIEADPNKTYTLTTENGPWMIMATTFRGESAVADAHQLVLELRRDFKLPAYMHEKVFDFSESFVGRGKDKYGNPKMMRHQANERIQEVAVLVGNFGAVDDPQAQRDLKKVKTARPDVLNDQAASRTFSKLRDMQKKSAKAADDPAPMRLAFVTANPLLPDGYYRPQGIDRFVEQLNEGRAHNLLKCPANYTVRVATFTGCSIVDPKRIKAVESGDEWSFTRLEAAAAKAHHLTIALRAKGYEAYQFHNRNSSIVTVGSFHRPPVNRPDGTTVLEPQVQELIHRFGAKPKVPSSVAGVNHPGVTPVIQPESLLGIPFDIHPMLIQVPKRSIASDYANGPN